MLKLTLSIAFVLSLMVVSSGRSQEAPVSMEIVLKLALQAVKEIRSAESACGFHVSAAIVATRAGQRSDAQQDLATAWCFLETVPAETRRLLLMGILDAYLQGKFHGPLLVRLRELSPQDLSMALLILTVDKLPSDDTNVLINYVSEEINDGQCSASLCEVMARLYLDEGRIDEAIRIVDAFPTAEAERRIEGKNELLLQLVARSAEQRDYDGAKKLAHLTTNAEYRDAAFLQLVSIAADNGDANEACCTLQSIRCERPRDVASFRIIRMLVQRGQFLEANRLLCTVQDHDLRGSSYEVIAVAYAHRGCFQDAKRTLEKALDCWSDSAECSVSRHRVSLALFEAGLIGDTEAVLQDIADPAQRSEVLKAVAAGQTRLGCSVRAAKAFRMAAESLGPTQLPISRATLLRELATTAINCGQCRVAHDILMRASQEASGAGMNGGGEVLELCATGSLLVRHFGIDSARSTFDSAVRSAEQYPDEAYVAQLLQKIARCRTEAGDANAAFTWGTRETDNLRRVSILLGVAEGLIISPSLDSHRIGIH